MTNPSAKRSDAGMATMKKSRPHLTKPRILVVIPTLGNRLETLGRTLSSVQNQTGVMVDVVIVAKTMSPELSTIADHHNARIIIHPGNISAAINAGFSQATEAHKYVAWLGDDDLLRPDGLTSTSVLLEHHPEAVVAYGSCDYINLNGDLLFNRRPPSMAPALLQFIPGLIKQETCLFRFNALQKAGGLDEKLKFTMDLDLLLKLRRFGSFIKAENVIAAFCWHPGSLTVTNRKVSLVEAQDVQRRHTRGFNKALHSLLKFPIRYLILTLNWKINNKLNQSLISKAQSSSK